NSQYLIFFSYNTQQELVHIKRALISLLNFLFTQLIFIHFFCRITAYNLGTLKCAIFSPQSKCQEMMALFPEHKPTKHDYTQALFFSGYEEKAIEMEQEMLQEDPTALYCHTNLALFYYEMNQKQAYETRIQALLNVYPIHEQQKLKVAVTLARTGNFQEALVRFRSLSKGFVTGQLSYYKWYS